MPIERLPAGERPHLEQVRDFPWATFIDQQIHPVKVAVIEALRWVGGPLSAHEIWRLGIGEPNYQSVNYHVAVLVKDGLIVQTHESPKRGSLEKFYLIAA